MIGEMKKGGRAMKKHAVKTEYLYAAVSIFFWGTSATLSKLMLSSLSSMQVLVYATLLSSLVMLLLNVVKGTIREFRSFRVKDYLKLAGIGLLGTFCYKLTFYWGLQKLGSASEAFIINYLWPLMSVLFACLLLGEKLTVRKLIAVLLSFCGVVLVTTGGNFTALSSDTLVGALLCASAAAFYGLFTVLNKKAGYNNFASMLVYYTTSFVFSVIFTALTDGFFVPTLPQAAGIAWEGIFIAAIGFTSWAMALSKGDTAKISNLAYITPFLSLVWTTVILREPLDPFALIGLVLIVAGIFVQMRRKEKE